MSSDFEKYFLQKLYSFTTSYIIRSMKKIIAYKRYYADFMSKLSQPERIKIMRVLLLFETEDKIPHHYIKAVQLKKEYYEQKE